MDNKFNICLMNDSFPPLIDGVSEAILNYAKIINEEYGTAAVVTPTCPGAEDEKFDFPVIRYHSIDTTKLVGYRAGYPFSPDTLGKLRQLDIDIIHSHCPFISTYLARSLRCVLKTPVILTYHTKFDIDIANLIKPHFLQKKAVNLMVQNVNYCDEIWAVSDGAGKNLQSLGYKGDYIVMPNGVDLPRGRVSDEQIAKACNQYDLPDDVPVFLFVGRMRWYKGIRIIEDALASLKKDGCDFRMVFIGNGMDFEEIKNYAKRVGIDERCIFTGPIRDREVIRAWYCRATLFLFPSTFDTNGLVVREAAACGLASVLIDGSCAAEDIEDGRTGFLIKENARSLAASLYAICGNRDKAVQVGTTAMNEIYLSWHDSVANAAKRYEIVKERHQKGLTGRKETEDDFFRFQGELMKGMSRMHDFGSLVYKSIRPDQLDQSDNPNNKNDKTE